MEPPHNPIAGNFGDDGSRGNCRYFFIAFDDGSVPNVCRKRETAVQLNHLRLYQAKLPSVEAYLGAKLSAYAARAEIRRLRDIDPINHFRPYPRYRPFYLGVRRKK